MTDKEILSTLTCITPESYSQWKKLKKCILTWMDNSIDHTDEYVGTLTESHVLDRPCIEVYEEYTQWCEMNYIKDIVHINAFSKYLRYYFNVSSKLIKGKKCYCK